MEEFVDEKFGLLKGLQPTFFRSGKILCERFRCKLKVILRLVPFCVRKDILQIPRHRQRSLSFVVYCAKNGSLFKLQALSARSA